MTKFLTKILYLWSKLQIDNSQIFFAQKLGKFYYNIIFEFISIYCVITWTNFLNELVFTKLYACYEESSLADLEIKVRLH